jgi:hypothetical protein
MRQKIGYKRLQSLIAERVNPANLPLEAQFAFAVGMAHTLLDPLGCTPKRDRPKCNARCRTGRRCQARAVWDKDYDCPRNGKCRLHGGLSTGPRTPEGRRRIGEATRQRAQARRLAQAQAAVRAEALAAYQAALALYEATCQRDMTNFPGLKSGFLQIQGYQVELAYQRCLDCGVDPRACEETV